MRPKLYTFDSHAINDGSYLKATFSSNTNFFELGEIMAKLLKRNDRPPVVTQIEIKEKVFELVLLPQPATTFTQKIDDWHGWFNTRVRTARQLIIKDEDDSDRQWYLNTYVLASPMVEVGRIIYRLLAPDCIWKTVLENVATPWTVVVDGDTEVFTTRGNHYAEPTIQITPNSAKAGGAGFAVYRAWRNPIETPYAEEALDIMSAVAADTSVSNQINNGAGYSAADLSLAIDTSVGGGLPTGGGICYNTRTGEKMRYSGIAAGTMTVITGGRGWDGTTAATINDNDVLARVPTWNTAALVSDTSKSNQINNGAGYSASDLSLAIDVPVGGGLPTGGGMCYNTRTGEQMRYSGIAAGVMTVIAGGRGWGGTTTATINDNDVLTRSKMVADGRDIRAWRNEQSIPRWLDGVNTPVTKVFTECDFEKPLSLTLDEAITGVGDLTYVQFAVTDLPLLDKLGKKESKVFGIGTEPNMELFTFTALDFTTRRATGITRGAFSSTKTTHAVGDACKWMQYIYKVSYGNADASAPTQDESKAPIFDKANSSNVKRKYTEFYDKTGLRLGSFKSHPIKGKAPYFYSDTQDAVIDPATVVGLAGAVYNYGGGPKADSYGLRSYLYHPAGFTGITCNGKRRREETEWCSSAGIFQGDALATLQLAESVASPAAVDTWDTWSSSSPVTLTKHYVAFGIDGNVAAKTDNKHRFEVLTIDLLKMNPSNVPQMVFEGTEQDAYELDCRITNSTIATDHYIEAKMVMGIGQTLEIDCEAMKATYLKDGSPADRAVTFPKRSVMMVMGPGTDASPNVNTLKYEEAGLTSVTVAPSWYDRNT